MAGGADDDLPVGTEVEAHGLRNTTELNGARGYVAGRQRAPDGAVLVVVRLERGETRLFNRGNLQPASEAPMPNLTGAWGCWFSSPHVFHHVGNQITIVDTSTGETYDGVVSRERLRAKASLAMKTVRAEHPQGWVGPLDDEPKPGSTPDPDPIPRKKLVYPWEPKKRKPVLSLHAMGTVGVFDGDAIKWKSGTVWRRQRSRESDVLVAAHPSPTHAPVAAAAAGHGASYGTPDNFSM